MILLCLMLKLLCWRCSSPFAVSKTHILSSLTALLRISVQALLCLRQSSLLYPLDRTVLVNSSGISWGFQWWVPKRPQTKSSFSFSIQVLLKAGEDISMPHLWNSSSLWFMVTSVSGLIPELREQIVNALCITPSIIMRNAGGDHKDGDGRGDTVLMVISTESKKEHLLSFSSLFTLCEGTPCVAVAIASGF